MKIGAGNRVLDSRKIDACQILDIAKEHSLEGVSFKSILDMSPTLDKGKLKSIKEYASSLGLYIEAGLVKINPYNIAEKPEIRKIGEGDTRLGYERMISACSSIDCKELCVVVANYQYYPNRFTFDRFRTDVSWEDQLEATLKFMKVLAPCLRDHGCRLNIETHEDSTTYEVVRLVEGVGVDVAGITFDTGNVLARAEDPVAATQRVAPYVHSTHIKDAILFFNEEGLVRQPRPCGEGIIDWETILPILYKYSPDLNLTLEDHKGLMPIQIYLPEWTTAHPDLTAEELSQVVHLATICEDRIKNKLILDPATYEAIPWEDQKFERLQASTRYIRTIIQSKELHSPGNK